MALAALLINDAPTQMYYCLFDSRTGFAGGLGLLVSESSAAYRRVPCCYNTIRYIRRGFAYEQSFFEQ